MTISEVKTSNDQKEFIGVATIIYKNESKWIYINRGGPIRTKINNIVDKIADSDKL